MQRADLGGQNMCTQIFGPDSILDPPHHSTFNGWGGGSDMTVFPCMDLKGQMCAMPRSTVEVPFQTPPHSTFNDGGGSDMGGFPVWAPLLSWHLLLASPPSSCHLCSTRPPVHQSHHSFPPCLIRTHSPSTHPRGMSFSVSLPLVFPHLSLSLSHHPVIGDMFPFDKSHPTTVSPWPPQDLPHSSSGLSSSHFHI
jgi:hypothetical protein